MSKELHDEIMNLPCERTMSHFATQNDMRNYKEGHRNARHAAAELALSYMAGAAKSGNTSEKITLAAANKATEEGELPELPHTTYNGYSDGSEPLWTKEQMHGYATQAIAADRASRQVANKAEVEPVAFMTSDKKMLVFADAMRKLQFDPAGMIALYEYPPATTGASTAPLMMLRDRIAEMREASYTISQYPETAQVVFDSVTDALDEIASEVESVGASTVLTDERIAAIWHETACAEGEGTREYPAVFARAIEREVEAQAGQNCFLSWGGKNVHGDEASIKAVKAALHDAGTVPELKDRIRDLQAQAGQVAVPGWISVDERYPEFTLQNRYLVASNWGVTVAHLHDPQWARNCFQDCVTKNDEGMTDFDGYQKGVFKVTHWMPLPADPSPAKESK